jgi:hypothetical protein
MFPFSFPFRFDSWGLQLRTHVIRIASTGAICSIGVGENFLDDANIVVGSCCIQSCFKWTRVTELPFIIRGCWLGALNKRIFVKRAKRQGKS